MARTTRNKRQILDNSNSADAGANLSRRSLLSWLGSATVIALNNKMLTACSIPSVGGNATIGKFPEGTTLGSFEFPFRPSSDDASAYDKWYENTVDEQDLEAILNSWQLEVTGLIENPMTFTFADLLSLPRQDQVTDFHCVEGWSVFDVPWNGVHLNKLTELVRPAEEATHIALGCFKGIYSESLPLDVALESKTLLAYGVGGATLPFKHGFPLRLVVPRMYGYKSAKWVNKIDFTNTTHEGYWEQYGYATNAPVSPSRLREGKY